MYRRDRSRPSGLHSWCRDCRKAASDNYLSNPDKRAANRRRSKEHVARLHNTSPCAAPGCVKLNYGDRAYCSGHYQRLMKHGDLKLDVPVGSATRKGNGPCWTYLAVDVEGVVRYVGATSARRRRVSEHRKGSWWFSQISEWRWTEFETATEALAEEERLIRYHAATIHNKMLVPKG